MLLGGVSPQQTRMSTQQLVTEHMAKSEMGQPSTQDPLTPADNPRARLPHFTKPNPLPTNNPKYGCPLMPVSHWNPIRLPLLLSVTVLEMGFQWLPPLSCV